MGLASASGASTSCKSTPTATVVLNTGEERDALSRDPAPSTLIVESVGLDGKATALSRTFLPSDSLSLGDHGRTDVGAFRIRAVDPAGKTLLRGESLFVQFGALESGSLQVFVQRTGELGFSLELQGARKFASESRLVA